MQFPPDQLVIFVGHSRDALDEATVIKGLEAEFQKRLNYRVRHIKPREIPRLIFLIDEDHPVARKDIETGPGAEKLNALKGRIGRERVTGFFKSPGELRGEAVAALTTLARELETAETGDDAAARAAAKLHRRISIPSPPEPYIAHPYTLLQSRELIGRTQCAHGLGR
jgi:hypothetical protein